MFSSNIRMVLKPLKTTALAPSMYTGLSLCRRMFGIVRFWLLPYLIDPSFMKVPRGLKKALECNCFITAA